MDGDELALRRHTMRMHEEDERRDDMLHLEGAKRVHVMTIDTDTMLVVVDPFNRNIR